MTKDFKDEMIQTMELTKVDTKAYRFDFGSVILSEDTIADRRATLDVLKMISTEQENKFRNIMRKALRM